MGHGMTAPPAPTTLWDDARLRDPHAQPDKAGRIRSMFDAIAPTYERVNRLLSAGRDAYWRRRAVELANVTRDDVVLDVACGTGDFARAFAAAKVERVFGCDFSAGMLAHATGWNDRITWFQADALALPFAADHFTVVSCAFGVRNFNDLSAGLGEAVRVLRPGGRLVILEFSVPRVFLLGRLYRAYFHYVLPRVAAWLSGDRQGAYRYLPRSVSTFLDAPGMLDALQHAGFCRSTTTPLTLGIVTVYVAWKPS
jgi:demethylmenaquinone methyltransferase/2-methoxy-6-polyprenyl-1,4-benzoquinol methylase